MDEILVLIPNTCCHILLILWECFCSDLWLRSVQRYLIATFSLGREISEFDFIVHLLSK